MQFWEMELKQIEETTSPGAMDDLWSGVLAGLRGVETDADFDRLALKAQTLCTAERDLELRDYLENRIDEIAFERRTRKQIEARTRKQAAEKRGGKLLGDEP